MDAGSSLGRMAKSWVHRLIGSSSLISVQHASRCPLQLPAACCVDMHCVHFGPYCRRKSRTAPDLCTHLAGSLAAGTVHSAKVARAKRRLKDVPLRQGHPILSQARAPPWRSRQSGEAALEAGVAGNFGARQSASKVWWRLHAWEHHFCDC